MAEIIKFIECTSLSVSYNIMGTATVSYTVVHNVFEFITFSTVRAANQTFKGWVVNASLNPIPNTEGWYETHVTLVATTT
jgi:hypothetical protein